MVISPPFLPAPIEGETEAAFLARAMVQPDAPASGVVARRGSFPVSASLMWHNGLHLTAPRIDDQFVPVRAIADGKVIHVRQPEKFSTQPDHPLNRTAAGDLEWTDNGCVIVEHTTDIGAAAKDVLVSFTYFSLYMHLSAIEPTVVVGAGVWRKDALGKAGKILGGQSTIHFEICCDDAQIAKLIGRTPAWIEPATEPPPTANGRTDCVYGDIVIYLPATTAVAYDKPTDPRRIEPGTQTRLLTSQWVVLKYDKGNLVIRSLDLLGKAIGKSQVAVGAEYELYNRACQLHAQSKWPGTANSPSGWYELLRFGRNLGPDALPMTAANWQSIPTAKGTIWADLNYPGTWKFSEADFLTVMNWKIVKDDLDHLDQRAQSFQMIRLLQTPVPNSPEREKPGHKEARVGLPEVVEKLKNVIFYFPSEWDIATVQQRMGWVRDKTKVDRPMDDTQWGVFKKHFNKLCMENLPEAYKKAMWRINPLTFIEIMRRCSWLSKSEFMQMIPQHIIRGKGAGMTGPFFYERSEPKAGLVIEKNAVELNKMMRKFGISSPLRMAAFVGNSNPETNWWASLEERGGKTLRYYPWHGRGFLQLTNPDGKYLDNNNYKKYFIFRGFAVVNAPSKQSEAWRDNVALLPVDAAQSAGAYWAWMNIDILADKPSPNIFQKIKIEQKNPQITEALKVIYKNVSFRKVACAINLPAAIHKEDPKLNGLADRYSAYTVAQLILMDLIVFPAENDKVSFIPENFSSRKPS